MTGRTRPVTLILLALVAAMLAWMLESWLVSSGRQLFVAPITMPITLVLVAAALLVLAWPIRGYTRALRRARDERLRNAGSAASRLADHDPDNPHAGEGDETSPDTGRRRASAETDPAPKRVDPLMAVRVLAFAKASSLAGSVIAGGTAAVLVFVLTRPVVGDALVVPAIASVGGAVVLVAAGLVAESWCVMPPDDHEQARTAPSRPLLGA